jgi:prephenate dehydrogenase
VLAQSKLFRQALDRLEALIKTGDATELESAIRQTSESRGHWHMGAPRR